ncbi:MAG: hypothetical protein RL708_869 [Bacteroidota bacterium]|jgi:hypothetical protein
MEFTTSVKPNSYPFSIHHQDKIFTIGSCFSENIGKKFLENKFNIQINPFGQQYNPASIAQGIDRIIHSKFFTDDDIIYRDELYHCWQHHSDFSKPNKEELLVEINNSLKQNLEHLKQADYLFITFGTSHVFHWKADGRIVSNCHKISGSEFDFRFLSSDEIVEQINNCLNAIKTINNTVKIILTISPVRYLAFGFFENNLSKANLFVAIDKLMKDRNDCFYFPAYEIVMDELRDYRFFAEDMLHPNHQASQYVWEKMCSMMMQKETIDLMHEIYKINAAVNHKPRNENSDVHKKFIQNTIQKINILKQKSGIMNWEEEIEKLSFKN